MKKVAYVILMGRELIIAMLAEKALPLSGLSNHYRVLPGSRQNKHLVVNLVHRTVKELGYDM